MRSASALRPDLLSVGSSLPAKSDKPDANQFVDLQSRAMLAVFSGTSLTHDVRTTRPHVTSDHIYSEGATEGAHASDLGFFRQTNIFEPLLKTPLGR